MLPLAAQLPTAHVSAAELGAQSPLGHTDTTTPDTPVTEREKHVRQSNPISFQREPPRYPFTP